MIRTHVLRAALVAAIGVAAACGQGNVAVECERPGDWPHTPGAAWVARVIAAAGYERTGCTGSAFVIDTGGRGRSGQDLYVWGWRGRVPRNYSRQRVRIGGVEIHYNRLRAVWQAREHVVWLEAGPTTRRLLPVRRMAPLVRASVDVD